MEDLQAYLVWEHFSEDDDRERSTKQLCNFDHGPATLGPFNQSFTGAGGVPINAGDYLTNVPRAARGALSQGCLPASLYSPVSYETPNGAALSIVYTAQALGYIKNTDPYASETQSMDLRSIQSTITPRYKAKNDIVEFITDYTVTPALKLTWQTGYNSDFLSSSEDFNRFNSNPGLFSAPQKKPIRMETATAHPASPTRRVATCAILNSGVPIGWSAKTRARNIPGRSARKFAWRRISADRSISASAATICITRRPKIISFSSIYSR